jgi:hypothetical protein
MKWLGNIGESKEDIFTYEGLDFFEGLVLTVFPLEFILA